MSCNNADKNQKESIQSKSDSLLNLVLAGHDIAMPQTYKLERLEKETKSQIDSLNKISNTKGRELALLNESLIKLQNADSSMRAWMSGFKYDSLKENEAQREIYLKAQLESVNKTKDSVLGSINYADSVLKTIK